MPTIQQSFKKYLHPEDYETFFKGVEVCEIACRYLGVECGIFEPKKRPLSDNAWGQCWYQEKRISIAFRFKYRSGLKEWETGKRHPDAGRWFKEPIPWELVKKVICHEICHLIHPNHSKEFRLLEYEVCQYMDVDIDKVTKHPIGRGLLRTGQRLDKGTW